MIKKETHIKVIDKFFNRIRLLDSQIEELDKKGELTDEEFKLFQRFGNMMDIWMMMDDYLETIDNQINIAMDEEPELFEKYRK